MAKEKHLPHNTEAEKSVLGSMIRSHKCVSDAVANLDADDFYPENQNHRAIFNAIFNLSNKNEPIDVQTITNELINSKELEISGAPEYLMELADSIVTFDNFNTHMKIIKNQATLRRFLAALEDISKHIYTKEIDDIEYFLREKVKLIGEITEQSRAGEFRKADAVASELADQLAKLKSSTSDDTVTGTPTGFTKLNILTHGFQPGQLIVLAARPGVGKTALSLNLALNAATHNIPVAYFSLEMPATDLFKRLVSADSGVKYDSLITGFGLSTNDRLNLAQSCERLGRLKFYTDDTSGVKLLDLVARCRNLKAQEPDLGLIVVDYIGLVSVNTKTKSESRQLEVQMISQTLKKLALELKIPIIGVAQLNRNVEMRQGGEPQLSDLRESGSIEQDADIVLMLHETKLEDTTEQSGKKPNVFETQDKAVNQAQAKVANASGDSKLVTILVRKNRSGKQGRVPLLFRKDFCRFDSLSEEASREYESLESERVHYVRTDE